MCELDLAFAVRCKSGEVQTQWKLLISCNHSKGCKHSLSVSSIIGRCHESLGRAGVGLRETNFMYVETCFIIDYVL